MFTRSAKKASLIALLLALMLLASQALAVTYRLGDDAAEISTIQTALKKLKYYTGDITGHFGERTQEAVVKFQKRYNLSADGIVGKETLDKLYEKAGITAGTATASSSSSSASSSSSSLLRYGSEGTAVSQLQQNLKDLGYYNGSVTGHFGSKTETAVAAFQRANGLSADGIAGAKTLAAIAQKASGSSSSASTSASSSSSSSLQLDTSVTLTEGSKNANVKKLQQMLQKMGFYSGSITGSFGSKTKQAVMAYQKSKGLSADGIAGKKTLAAINADYGSGSSSGGAVSASKVQYANFFGWRTKYANGEYCTVYDPATGYSWRLRIMSKDNHMDAEPVTASDTATMNKAFGGKTTWTPKVVYVTFSDGKVYIGSTHNTPHGTQKVSGNNFNGHLCVHFPITMSKAESIGKYAVSHQEAINAAWEKVKAQQY